MIQEPLQIEIGHPCISCPNVRLRLCDRLLGTAPRSEAVAPRRKRGVPVRLQDLQQSLLDEPVQHHRDTEVAGAASRFRDVHPTHRLRLVGTLHQGRPEGGPVGREVRHQVVHGHAVDPRRPSVASDLAKRPPEVRGLQHPLHKVRPFHRSVGSCCPRDGFIPWRRQGQPRLPVGCMTVTRQHGHCSSPSSPSRATVRAFDPSVAAPPIRYPAFRRRGASIASPATGLLCPLLTSPGRSEPVTRLPVLTDNRETSRGTAQSCHRVDARCIKHTPHADGGLRGHVPARPRCTTPHIWFLFVAPRLWIALPPDPTSR